MAALALPLPPEEGFRRAAAAAKASTGWVVVSEDVSAGRIEAVATTRLLRYKDDVVIEIRASAEGCAVHMRSKSRLGRGDFGANAKRIRSFLGALAASR